MSDTSCLFCRIAGGDIPAEIVHETEHVLAFRDIEPQAPSHVLVIPKRHITSLASAVDADADVLAHLLLAARDIAQAEGIAASGFRAVTNTGEEGGQAVGHLHLHVLGGRSMAWPPG